MCGCNNGCTGCGGNCGQPVQIVSKVGLAAQILKYSDTSGIPSGSPFATYTKIDSTAFPATAFSSYTVVANQLKKAGDYVEYNVELVSEGDNSIESQIQVRLNEDWPYTAANFPSDGLVEIVKDIGVDRVSIRKNITRILNNVVNVILIVEKYDINRVLLSTEKRLFAFVMDIAKLPTHGAVNLDTDPIEISLWLKSTGVSVNQGVGQWITNVHQYNLP